MPPAPRYPGTEALIGGGLDAGPPGRPDRTGPVLPPQWVDVADKAQEEIKEIQVQLQRLMKAQQRRLLRLDLGEGDKEVEAISASISTLVRCCEKSIHQVRGRAPSSDAVLDDEFRHNMQKNLAVQLQSLSKQCRQVQQEYMAEVKRRRNQAEPAAETKGSSSSMQPEAAGGYHGGHWMEVQDQTMAELQEMEEVAAHRSSEIAQIATSISELNAMFKDLAAIVIDQGTILDRIDYNTENIYQKSEDAKGQMQKAVQQKREGDSRAMKCFMMWGAADAVMLLLLLVKYQMKYGLQNVLIFLAVVSLIIVAAYFAWKFYGPRLCPQLPDIEKTFPAEWYPSAIWKKIRPGPVNSAKAANAMRQAMGGQLPV